MTGGIAFERIIRGVAATAAAIDAGELPATTHLAELAAHGLIDQGVQALLDDDPSATDLTPMASTIAALAEECVPTAFGLWAHRMALDYLARGDRSAATERVLADLRRGARVGVSAMAAGLKSLAGVGDLTITATPDPDAPGGYLLNGRISWASNLVAGAIVVLPAAVEGSPLQRAPIVAWLHIEAAGFDVRHVTGLLALDSTASGTVRLTDVPIRPDQVISRDLHELARGFRPTFLVLQSAFCAGLVTRSLAEAERSLERGDNAVFAREAAALHDEVADYLRRFAELAADVGAHPVRDYLQLRLDSTHLASRTTRLEATLTGGQGYLTSSATSRRFREAAFLPVQSPSEGQLRWELSLLDSTGSTPATGRAAS